MANRRATVPGPDPHCNGVGARKGHNPAGGSASGNGDGHDDHDGHDVALGGHWTDTQPDCSAARDFLEQLEQQYWQDQDPDYPDAGDPADWPDDSEARAYLRRLEEEYWQEPPPAGLVFLDPNEGIPPECLETPVRARRPQLLTGWVSTDSEWDLNRHPDPWVSTALAARGDGLDRVVVYFPTEVKPATQLRLLRAAPRILEAQVQLVFLARTDGTDLLAGAKGELLPGRREVVLSFFFSPKDVEFAKGWVACQRAYANGWVHQNNALTGRVEDALLWDVRGWSGPQKLVNFANALGIPMPDKTSMDVYKTNMWRGLQEEPESYLRYAVGDARVLLDICERFMGFYQDVRGLLGLPRSRKLVPTQGRLVAELFENWLLHQAGAQAGAVRFCLRKLGYLDSDHPDHEQNLANRCRLLDQVRTPEVLQALGRTREGREALRHYHKARYRVTALGACGKAWWGSRPTLETSVFNALVQGGRCHNERPDQYRIQEGLDVDISGCYGETLRSLTYPVGLPSCWSWNPNERRPHLGAWLRRHEKSLVPGLWTVLLSGRLPFSQDLLFSKITRAGALRQAGPDADLSADLALLRRELKNAVLTADILTALRAVATAAEWAALQELELVTAIAYRAEDRVDGAPAWCRAVMADEHEGATIRYGSGTREDRRTRSWYGVPLEEFVGRLADRRQECKARAWTATDPEEVRRWEGLSAVLKLVINSVYGDLASRFFAMGSTVLANTITARARLGVWMVAKALGLRQAITDGGIYEPAAVPCFRGKRPGLDTLSRPWEWSNRKHGRGYQALPGLTWRFGEPLPANADAAALEHVNNFWEPYGLSLPFTLEHKQGFRAAAYFGRADYALDVGDQVIYKLRGKSRNKKDDHKPHPHYALLDAILDGADVFPTDLTYSKGGILKVKRYLQCQNGNGYQNLRDLRPGDSLPTQEYTARYNNTHLPCDDEQTFRRRRDRKKVQRREPVPWFEKYGAAGIAAVVGHMSADNLESRSCKDPEPGAKKAVH
jgi:hypothetical protein